MKKVFLILGNDLILIEEKIKEKSQNYKIYSFKENKKRKEENVNLEILNNILQNLNFRLFVSKEDIVLKNLDYLTDKEKEKLIYLLKLNKQVNFFLIFNDEKKFEEFKILLKKEKVDFEELNLNFKWQFQFKKIIEEELKKLKINLSAEVINFLLDNYKNDFSLFFQDLKKIKYYSQGKNLSLEELKNLLQSTANEFQIQESFLSLNFPVFLKRFKKYINSLQAEGYEKRKEKVEGLIYNLLFGALLKIYFLKQNNQKFRIEGNPYYLKKLKDYSQKLDFKTIKFLIKVLALTDKKIKKYYLQPKDIPEEIVFNFYFHQKLD